MSRCWMGRGPMPPLLPVRLPGATGPIWCKAEYLNPSGSIKDRIAVFIIGKALRAGQLAADGTVVEASSGSTAMAMALACAQFGLRFVAVMPQGVSSERVVSIRAYGGTVELTPGEQGIAGALQHAAALAGNAGVFWPRQFSNPDNAETHRRWTAHEILAELPGERVDAVVSGVGTGGTIVGLQLGCIDHGCRPLAVVARPVGGHGYGGVECCSHSARIPGVVDGLSELWRPGSLVDERIVEVSDEQALATMRQLHRLGHPVGPSSGLNLAAALRIQEELGAAASIVTVLPDRLDRYLSTSLFDDLRG